MLFKQPAFQGINETLNILYESCATAKMYTMERGLPVYLGLSWGVLPQIGE